jgi:thioredoxin-like negative regulator of GroEL
MLQTETRPAAPYPARDISILTVTAEDFADVVSATAKPVLVQFTVSWARACRAQAHETNAVARDNVGRFAFVSVEADREEELTALMGVRALPTSVIMRNGRVIAQFRGYQSAERLRSALIAAETPRFA